jgi:hypothetical protein
MWRIVGPAHAVHSGGWDGLWIRWFVAPLERGPALPVIVMLTGTDLATAPETLPARVATAIATDGRSEVEQVLDWPVPPISIEMRSHRNTPLVQERERPLAA